MLYLSYKKEYFFKVIFEFWFMIIFDRVPEVEWFSDNEKEKVKVIFMRWKNT